MATRAIPVATALERYLRTAHAAGCPPDQLRNFEKGGYVAQPKQLLFHALARACDRPDGPTQLGMGGARGPGKSHCSAGQTVLDDCERFPGLKWLFLRSVGASARESFEDLINKAFPHLRRYYVQSRSRLDLPNGSQVLLGGFRTEQDIDKYLGIEYDGMTVEEVNLLTKKRYDMLRGSLRSSKPGWRPRIYVTFNPGGIGHQWVKSTFVTPWRRGAETDTRFVFATVDDNRHVNPEYLTYLDGLTGWLKKAWRHGDWDISAGQFFTTFRDAIHVREVKKLPAHWQTWLAMDYGWTHYTVVYLMAKDDDGNVYHIDEHAERRWLVERHAAAVSAMMERHGVTVARLRQFVAGHDCFVQRDDRTPTIADQWKVALGRKPIPAVVDRINGAAEYLRRLGDPDGDEPIQPTMFISPRCARLIDCIPALEHDPSRPEDVLKVDVDDDGNGGDDPYDASRYGVMVAARPRGWVRGATQ